MSVAPAALPVYLQGSGEAVFGLLHPGNGEAEPEVAVLLCPPFGWEDICSYRARRDWAMSLAEAGVPVLRIDLPGSGDSPGSPRDAGRLDAWAEAVCSSARWLRGRTGCRRLAVLGIGLGGLVACRALADGAPVDDLVLWGVPARGRRLVRELRALARLESANFRSAQDPAPPPAPEGELEVAGFVLTPQTVAELSALDVGRVDLPRVQGRRALLLERDGLGVDAELREALERSALAVTTAPGPGYGAMMAEPQEARSPVAVFDRVSAWLAESVPAAALGANPGEDESCSEPLPGDALPHELREVEIVLGGGRIRERPLTVTHSGGQLFGVLAEPLSTRADLTAVLLNAGAIRRIGPGRMWVEMARRWALKGVPTLRLDVEGIGDADGDAERYSSVAELYVPELVAQVRSALDVMEEQGLPGRFAVLGLCSGAYMAFHCALDDERVSTALMLNPRALFWDASLGAARDFRRGLLRPSQWRRIREVPTTRRLALARWALRWVLTLPVRILTRAAGGAQGDDVVSRALDRLRDTDKRAVFVFGGHEPLHEELTQTGVLQDLSRWPDLEVELIAGRDHTLRPTWAQREAHAVLDRALATELDRV